jgi:hypothetical protein
MDGVRLFSDAPFRLCPFSQRLSANPEEDLRINAGCGQAISPQSSATVLTLTRLAAGEESTPGEELPP